MKKFRLSVSIILTMTLLLSICVPVTAISDSEKIIQGTFSYMGAYSDSPITETYFYSDSYFDSPSTTKNEHLTTMSMSLAYSTMESNNSTYVKKLYDNIGFTDVQTENMDLSVSKDSIGTAIAHKKIGDSEVVAVAIRGSRYSYEWISNFYAGDSGDIKGFELSAGKVIQRLKAYIAEHNLTNVNIWISGYSRGGAVSDLAGVYINEHLDEFSTSVDDVFVYTFEAPRCSSSSKIYNNIYCIKNKNDIVPYVYPESWNIYTNGVDVVFGEDKKIETEKIDILSNPPTVPVGEINMEEFEKEFVDFVSTDLTREAYTGDFERTVAGLMEMYLSKPSSQWKKTFDGLQKILPKAKFNFRFQYLLLVQTMDGIFKHNSDAMYKQFADELKLALEEVATPESLELSENEYNILLNNLYPICRALGPVLARDYYYGENVDYSKVFPTDYNDADYDPQTSEQKVLTYDQYIGRASTPSENDSNTANSEAENEDYKKGLQDGGKQAEIDAQNDVSAKKYKESYNEAPLSDDFSEEYLKGYKYSYSKLYDTYYSDYYKQSYNQISLYHAGTFFNSMEIIINEHYPEVNFAAIKAMDSYYEKEIRTEPTSTEPTEQESEATNPIYTQPTVTEPTKPVETKPVATEPTVKQKTSIIGWKVNGIKNKTYTGKKLTQKITVTKGTKTASVSISYKNNINAGTATVTIKGKGGYTGTIVKTFKINKASQKMKLKAIAKILKFSKVKGKAQTVKKVVSVTKSYGKISYSKGKGSSKYILISKSGVITVKKNTPKGTHKILVKVTAKGNKNYKSQSKTIIVNIKVI